MHVQFGQPVTDKDLLKTLQLWESKLDGPFFGGERPHFGEFMLFTVLDSLNETDPATASKAPCRPCHHDKADKADKVMQYFGTCQLRHCSGHSSQNLVAAIRCYKYIYIYYIILYYICSTLLLLLCFRISTRWSWELFGAGAACKKLQRFLLFNTDLRATLDIINYRFVDLWCWVIWNLASKLTFSSYGLLNWAMERSDKSSRHLFLLLRSDSRVGGFDSRIGNARLKQITGHANGHGKWWYTCERHFHWFDVGKFQRKFVFISPETLTRMTKAGSTCSIH